MIPSIVLKSVLWRCSESAWTFWKFQLLRFSLRPIVDPKQPLLSVRNVCPFLGKDIHPITIPSLVMKSVLWHTPETGPAFCNFYSHPNLQSRYILKWNDVTRLRDTAQRCQSVIAEGKMRKAGSGALGVSFCNLVFPSFFFSFFFSLCVSFCNPSSAIAQSGYP